MKASEVPALSDRVASIHSHCHGEVPLTGRLEPWIASVIDRGDLWDLIRTHGSPLNIVATEPMASNIRELEAVANERDVDFLIFFARKSNKCLSFVDQSLHSNIGIDTASKNEIDQSLERGVSQSRMICTAAIKDDSLIDRCIERGICLAIDNRDELDVITERCTARRKTADIAIRLGGFLHDGTQLFTRFGFDVQRDQWVISELEKRPVRLAGVHFHLDGYDAGQRVSAIVESLDWIQAFQRRGHAPTFIDMGGGVPMSYLNEESQWLAFWHEHRRSLLGLRRQITYRNHGLGLTVQNGEVFGKPNSYPYFQSPVRSRWLAKILDATINSETIAHRLSKAKLQLRCEPGRSLLDGCGMTVAKVEFRKQNVDGDWLIGLSMNRTQCRTTSDDFLVDPILVPAGKVDGKPMSGFLVGAYCTESELISLRRLHFPNGVERGDLIVFPNTAGYLMHFLESRSHQFPLAKNLVHQDATEMELDPIDYPSRLPI